MTVELVYREIYFADNTTGLAAFAYDGTNYYPVSMQVDNTGELVTDASGLPVAIVGTVPVSLAGSVAVTGTFWQATQPISAASLPLPAGAATAAIQTSILSALGTPLQAGGTVSISGTTAVSASSLPLPSGAATASLQTAILTALGTPLQAGGNVAVTASALPTGAATAAAQTSILTALGTPAQDGTDGTGITPPTGATGIRGWLSGIFKALSNIINVSIQSLNFPASPGNTSTAQLAPGASFTGALDTVLSLQAAQVEVFSDQPFQLTVNQYIDAAGTELSSSDVFVVLGSAPFSYNQNVSLPGNYFNVVVTNLGSVATTALAVNTTYGIMATGPRTVTALGNNRSALNEVGGVPITAGQAKGAASLPVVLASDQSAMTVIDPNIAGATTSDAPLFTVITGDPAGDWAGVNLLERAMDSSGDLGFNVRVQNPPKLDVNGAAIPSDAPQVIQVYGIVGSKILIPTAGYQSIQIAATTLAGTITATTDNVIFTSVQGTPTNGGSPTSAMTAGSNWTFPCPAAYIVVTVTTAGVMSYILRQTGYSNTAVITAPYVAGAIGVNAGVVGVQAIGGNIATGTAPTANPVYVAGLDTSGKTRPVQTDTSGRVNTNPPDTVGSVPYGPLGTVGGTDTGGIVRRLGVIADPIANVSILQVQDRLTAEGMSPAELQLLMLRELVLMNQQLYEMKLNAGAGGDEPASYRADPSFQYPN